MIDLKEKEMSRGEFDNVARALGGWETGEPQGQG